MRTITVFLIFSLSSLFAFSQLSQSDIEYSKNTQALLKEYGGFPKKSAKKAPREYLANDKKLLDILEKAETFDLRYFKEDYRPLYEEYKDLVGKEEILVINYYYWLGKYTKTISDIRMSPWEKLCANIFKRSNHKKKKAIAAAQKLENFYNEAMIPILDSTLISFGKFWFEEKCRCTRQGIIWKEVVYY